MLQRKHKITQHIFHKVSSTFQKYKHILNIKHTKMTEANKNQKDENDLSKEIFYEYGKSIKKLFSLLSLGQ